MAAIDPDYVLKTKKFNIKPERLVSGLLHVQVKHEVQDQGGSGDLDNGELDVNYAYNRYWNTGSTPESPNGVPSDGDYPFLKSGTSVAAKPSYDASDSDFTSGRKIVSSDAPIYNGSDYSNVTNTTVPKKLSLGDHDCFLFYVTCAMHLEADYLPQNTVRSSTGAYHSYGKAHEKCQSFVKSHLIARINNTRNSEQNYSSLVEEESMWKQGIPVARFTNYGVQEDNASYIQPVTAQVGAGFYGNSDGKLGGTPTLSSPYYNEWVITNGVHEHAGFGLDLRTESNFFSPVWKVTIGTDHELAASRDTVVGGETNPATSNTTWQDISTQTHSITNYNLAVNVYLWAYDYSGDKAYTKNRVNVLWQPFGETADLGVEI